MEKLNDLSLSSSSDETESDQTSSADGNNCNASDEGGSKYEALTDELQTKTDDFIIAICTLKRVTTTIGKIHVKPLGADAYKKVDDFIASVDNIIKWYEGEINRYRSCAHIYLNAAAACTKQNEELQQTIVEQKETIDHLIESSTTMAKDFEKKVKVMEEKLKYMKVVETEMQAKCALMEQKEQEIKKQVKNVEVKADTANFILGTMKSNLGLKDDTIQYWKQHLEEANRLLHSKNVELRQIKNTGDATNGASVSTNSHANEAAAASTKEIQKEENIKSADVESSGKSACETAVATTPKAIEENPDRDVDKIGDTPTAVTLQVSHPAENEGGTVADKKNNNEDASSVAKTDKEKVLDVAAMRKSFEDVGLSSDAIETAIADVIGASIKNEEEIASKSALKSGDNRKPRGVPTTAFSSGPRFYGQNYKPRTLKFLKGVRKNPDAWKSW